MHNDKEVPGIDNGPDGDASPAVLPDNVEPAPNHMRRNLLRFAAFGGATIVTVRPGFAQATKSVMKCTIPVPDTANAGKWIRNSDGAVVNANTSGAIAGPSSPLKGEDVKNAIKYGTSYPGYSAAQTTTWNKYINKLTVGKQGYTCFASVQNPANT